MVRLIQLSASAMKPSRDLPEASITGSIASAGKAWR